MWQGWEHGDKRRRLMDSSVREARKRVGRLEKAQQFVADAFAGKIGNPEGEPAAGFERLRVRRMAAEMRIEAEPT